MGAPGPKLDAGEPSFLDGLRLHAAGRPDAAALIEPGGGTLTFTALERRIRAVAHAVTVAGVQRGDVVALVLPDGAGLIATFLGVASTAGCAVLNPALRGAEIAAALAALGARAVIADPVLAPSAVEAARACGAALLAPASLNSSVPPAWEMPAGGSRVALLLQTSATTGKARIVPLTHANLRAMAANTINTLKLTAADRFLSMMPLFHLQGLMASLAQLLAGGSVICTGGFEAGAFLAWLREHRPTWYTAGPTLHNAILPLVESHPDVIGSAPLRFVRSIGARLPQATMQRAERALAAPVLEGYGSTEAGAVTSNTPQYRKPGSCGRSSGTEVVIMDGNGQLLPPDREGEIVVRGAAVMCAYHNDPEADRNSFRDGWFRTGDLGRLDGEGYLYVTGRIKEMINRGGEKILPGEVEDRFLEHPAVAEAVVVGVAHPTLGEDVMAAVVLRPGAAAAEAELRRFAGERVAEFKLPRRIFFVSEIPKGETGKPARAAVSAQLQAELERAGEAAAPAGETERQLAAVWQRILNVETVGARDDFFRLGGDSLALALMLAEVEEQFGPAGQAEFLANPTLETLARIVAAAPGLGAPRSFLVPLQPHGPRVPFFCIPGADENPYYFLDLAKAIGPDQPFIVLRDPRPLPERGVYTLEQHAARFCEAIRAKCPDGPYFLGGHCYGGILAFEAARQLVSSGREVGLLALFEVPTPGYPKIVRHWREYARHSAILAASLARGHTRAVWTQVRAHAAVLGRLFGLRRLALERRVLLAAGGQKVVEPLEPLESRNQRAALAYVPGRLDCDVVHFLAAGQHHSTLILDDTRLGWRDMVGRRFSTCKVPGIAVGIFRPPHVTELAAQLRLRLDGAGARRP